VGESQEGKSRHAPGGEVVARRDVETDLAPEGQAHHENEDRDQEKPGEVAGGTIEAIETRSDHEGHACRSVLTMTARTGARKRRHGDAAPPQAALFRRRHTERKHGLAPPQATASRSRRGDRGHRLLGMLLTLIKGWSRA
jgi:hypothetical protein